MASNPWDFIEQWALAHGVTDEAVRKWLVRGVPGKFHLEIVEAARRSGVRITADYLRSPHKKAA